MNIGRNNDWPKREIVFTGKLKEIKVVKPWVILSGHTGSGKTTTALDLLLKNPAATGNEFVDVACELNDWLRKATAENFITYLRRSLTELPVLVLDDIGAEPFEKVMVYGTELNAKSEVINTLHARYSSRLTTIMTTNKTPNELKLYYGDRVYSRMAELSDVHMFTGDHRRGGKVTITGEGK